MSRSNASKTHRNRRRAAKRAEHTRKRAARTTSHRAPSNPHDGPCANARLRLRLLGALDRSVEALTSAPGELYMQPYEAILEAIGETHPRLLPPLERELAHSIEEQADDIIDALAEHLRAGDVPQWSARGRDPVDDAVAAVHALTLGSLTAEADAGADLFMLIIECLTAENASPAAWRVLWRLEEYSAWLVHCGRQLHERSAVLADCDVAAAMLAGLLEAVIN